MLMTSLIITFKLKLYAIWHVADYKKLRAFFPLLIRFRKNPPAYYLKTFYTGNRKTIIKFHKTNALPYQRIPLRITINNNKHGMGGERVLNVEAFMCHANRPRAIRKWPHSPDLSHVVVSLIVCGTKCMRMTLIWWGNICTAVVIYPEFYGWTIW